jgi:DNA-binding transcriptional ArsR family regulator
MAVRTCEWESGVRPASGGVLLSAECRQLRRALRPLVWVTLEEIALDASWQNGRLIAHTSARQIADRLKVDPGTVAGALRVLRQQGLVALEREQRSAGRFGLSVYVVGPVSGLTVVPSHVTESSVAPPWMVPPSLEKPDADIPDMVVPQVVQPCVARTAGVAPDVKHPHTVTSHTGESSVAELRRSRPGERVSNPAPIAARADETGRPASSSLQRAGQETLDLSRASS